MHLPGWRPDQAGLSLAIDDVHQMRQRSQNRSSRLHDIPWLLVPLWLLWRLSCSCFCGCFCGRLDGCSCLGNLVVGSGASFRLPGRCLSGYLNSCPCNSLLAALRLPCDCLCGWFVNRVSVAAGCLQRRGLWPRAALSARGLRPCAAPHPRPAALLQ